MTDGLITLNEAERSCYRAELTTVSVNVNGLSLYHKGSEGFVCSTLPDACLTPTGSRKVPVPYISTGSFGDSIRTANSVRINGKPAVTTHSRIRKTSGTEPGIHKGITSSGHLGPGKVPKGSSSLKIEGHEATRVSDVTKWVLTEAAWLAAGVVAGALTAGVGAAIVGSLRMTRVARAVGHTVGNARRAALGTAIGSAVGSGATGVIKLVRWMDSIPDRILLGVYGRFGNAVARLRGRTPRYTRQGQNGGEVHGHGPGAASRSCATGMC